MEELDHAVPSLALRAEERAVHVDRVTGQGQRHEQIELVDFLVELTECGVANSLAHGGQTTGDVEDGVLGVDERPRLKDATDIEGAFGVTRPHDGGRAATADTPRLGVAEVRGAHGRLAPHHGDVALVVEQDRPVDVDLHELAVAEVDEGDPLVVDLVGHRRGHHDLVVHGNSFFRGGWVSRSAHNTAGTTRLV